MGAALARSAFSPNIKERRDFSCALLDGGGRMVSQAAHIPVHLGSMPLSVRAALEDVRFEPGDVVVLNDPYRGGTHLPDVTLIAPIFLARRGGPEFFCANRAHHADVGGAHPGSMSPALDVHGEGLRIPPIKLVRRGAVDRDVQRLLLANMRVPAEREGDLMAQWAAAQVGVRRVQALAAEHGARVLIARGGDLIAWSAELSRNWIASLPRGRSTFVDYLESDRDFAVRVAIERRGSRLAIDWSESDDQVAAPFNTPRAVAVSAVFYTLRLLLPAFAPTNDGVLEPVEIRTRPGSLVDARYPAPVAAGNVETSQRLVDALLGALQALLPERIPAASSGTMSNLSFGGRDARGRAFTYYETIAGGAGGSPFGPGASGVHTHMTNTRNTPIEALENDLPVRVQAYGLRAGSGGEGAQRGGDGIVKRVLFLAAARVGWIGDRARRGPWGVRAASGALGRATVRRADGDAVELDSKTTFEVAPGDELEIATPGGGGWSPR